MTDRVAIRATSHGRPGLDQILGGGLPEFSFNLIAGAPRWARRRSRSRSCSPWPVPNVPRCTFTVIGEPRSRCCVISSSSLFSTSPV